MYWGTISVNKEDTGLPGRHAGGDRRGLTVSCGGTLATAILENLQEYGGL